MTGSQFYYDSVQEVYVPFTYTCLSMGELRSGLSKITDQQLKSMSQEERRRLVRVMEVATGALAVGEHTIDIPDYDAYMVMHGPRGDALRGCGLCRPLRSLLNGIGLRHSSADLRNRIYVLLNSA